MSGSYAINSGSNFYPDPTEPIMESIFQQYERVLVESLISSFGLDFLVKDQYGGDVDTIHNVREGVGYKNAANQQAYENRGQYRKEDYHGGGNYQSTKHEARERYQTSGQTTEDAYTGKPLHFFGSTTKQNAKSNAELDHVISAKSIHDDPGRTLAGLKGEDLANSKEN